MNDSSAPNRMPAPEAPRLTWPPPGLEPLHGSVGPLTGILLVGDIILILPLLLAVGRDAGFATFGLYGTSVWVPLLTTCIGIIIVIAGWERVGHGAWVANRSVRNGHDWPTVLHALVDGPRDTGFLIQGARIYSELSERRRGGILKARLTAALGYLVAAMWMPVGFAVALLLGHADVIEAGTMWNLTLGPTVILAVIGVTASFTEDVLARSPRRIRARQLASDETTQGSISSWNARLSTVWHVPVEKRGRANPFRVAAVATLVLAVIMVPTVFILSVSATVGSIFAAVALPDFSRLVVRSATVEMYRRYRLPTDDGITALAAGEALHALLMNQEDSLRAPLRRPVRAYQRTWFPAADSMQLVQVNPRGEDFDLFERARQGFTAAERTYLQGLADHPGRAEFATLAHAGSADVITARYDLPFAADQRVFSLAMPRYRSGPDGARTHLAFAALEAEAGRIGSAETAIRELISAGFLALDESRTAIDAAIAMTLVEFGGESLQALYKTTGRARDAEELAFVTEQTLRVAERAGAARPLFDLEQEIAAMPGIVSDTTMPRGFRWELLHLMMALTPCLNMHTIVFGPGESYDHWLASARRTLVRHPGDEPFLELVERGFLDESTCGVRGLVGAF